MVRQEPIAPPRQGPGQVCRCPPVRFQNLGFIALGRLDVFVRDVGEDAGDIRGLAKLLHRGRPVDDAASSAAMTAFVITAAVSAFSFSLICQSGLNLNPKFFGGAFPNSD